MPTKSLLDGTSQLFTGTEQLEKILDGVVWAIFDGPAQNDWKLIVFVKLDCLMISLMSAKFAVPPLVLTLG
jgi:hypothetical protein